MTQTRFVKPTESLLKQLAANMNPLDVDEVLASGGFTPLMALTSSVLHSEQALVVLVDGEPAACFGIAPCPDDPTTGLPWLLSTPHFMKIKRRFIRGSLDFIALWQEKYSILTVASDARHHDSHTWLMWLGFEVVEVYQHFGFGQLPFYRFEKCATQ